MQAEQPAGRRLFLVSNRKCGDCKFSLGRIIDRAKDIQSGCTWADKLLWCTVDQSATIPVRHPPLPITILRKVSDSLFNFPSRRSRAIEEQTRKLYQLCGNYFPRYCHRSCALLNKQLIVHGVNLYEILLRELGLPFANLFRHNARYYSPGVLGGTIKLFASKTNLSTPRF